MAISSHSGASNHMRYGRIAGSSHVSTLIYRCFEHIREEDERKFVKKFREQPPDSDEIIHTFRELVLGAYLCSQGLRARYDHVVDGYAPDWSILAEDSELKGIVELTSFHIDKATENEVKEQLRAGGVTFFWRDANKDNVDRLYYSSWHKADVYRALVQELGIPYIVAVFGEFLAAIDFEEVCRCLFNEEFGLFDRYPEVSGVMYFEETSRGHLFRYAHNPNALRVFDLLSGVFLSEAA